MTPTDAFNFNAAYSDMLGAFCYTLATFEPAHAADAAVSWRMPVYGEDTIVGYVDCWLCS